MLPIFGVCGADLEKEYLAKIAIPFNYIARIFLSDVVAHKLEVSNKSGILKSTGFG